MLPEPTAVESNRHAPEQVAAILDLAAFVTPASANGNFGHSSMTSPNKSAQALRLRLFPLRRTILTTMDVAEPFETSELTFRVSAGERQTNAKKKIFILNL